mmetsp:Transcript_22861/g.57008  ORF Transcript_22861/g.57008 Transcript_22861/m.57008 type:complete len:4427 (+) Transcript_22861:2-13282(+)
MYENGSPEELFFTSGDGDRIKQRGIYFVRVCDKAVGAATVDTDLNCGVIEGLPVANMKALVGEVYSPLLNAGFSGWDKRMTTEAKDDLYGVIDRFSTLLGSVVESLANGLELKKPTAGITIENKPAAIAKAAADARFVSAYEEIVEDWCNQVDRLLAETDDNRNEPDDAGPSTELEYWRSRMGKFNSITEQLKQPACKTLLAVLQMAKARVMKRWRTLDNTITDATNEAKDNVKYLSTLEKYIEPLYAGDPLTIIDALPGLLNNTRMMLTIARYYSTRERMTLLFRKVTNQMIANCREHVTAGGVLWSQPTHSLIGRLQACITLNEAYQDQYHQTRERLEQTPSGKQFDFELNRIFGKFDLFQRRVEKLVDMFNTFDQFSALARHNIEGMDGFIGNFFGIMDEFKRKPYDLLDFQLNQFDRDYLEFSANIHELESSLQGFINQSFESISSTENALMLLKQFQVIMQRESLKDDLDSKLAVIFHNYQVDLETVQRLYEKQKSSPPAVRNMPPVAANVAWARQLMRRIEVPMHKFQLNPQLMGAREAKKITKTYNKIAKTIIEFETLWKLAWAKGIDSARAGLHATLLVRHPSNNKLYANFDREILQLLRETKCLLRMGEDVPEAARMVLLQEDKLKSYYNKLSYALGEYEALIARLHPLTHPLLKPHLMDMDAVLQPGMVTLTWTSMNIDGYVMSIHAGLFKLNDLVSKIQDLVDNRIDRNVRMIAGLDLVDLRMDESYTLDTFVAMQEKHTKDLTTVIRAKSMEVEAAVADLIALIQAFPREHVQEEVSEEEISKIRAHFASELYLAVLQATSTSLVKIKDRVGSRTSAGFLYLERPFFDVQVELEIPNVVMNPSLVDIQGAINKCSRAILSCSKEIAIWRTEANGGKAMYELISKDRDVIKTVLLLTGSIEGAKRQVYDYLLTFIKYDWLWKGNMQQAYQEFMAKDPSLEDFEMELKRYVDVEGEITKIPPVHNIGALSLETGPLKSSLMTEANAWKAQYAQNLHRQARTELDRISQWLHDMNRNLKRDVNDLDDVRSAVNYLESLRDKEANLDAEFGPVEDMYALLARYDVPVPKEETDIVTDLRYSWKKLKKLSADLQEHLSQMQAPFKKNLVRNIKLFVVDVIQFRNDFEANGPMVPGVAPMEADERLRKFQRLFEERERKWIAYSEGQKLFGLPVTEYKELEQTKEELQLLEKLYGLYTLVINTVSEFKEVLWADVKDELDGMTAKISEFQNGCKKMPKALREWDAYIEMKKTIDDFLESLPMVQDLTHTGMRDRHWTALEQVCGQELPVHAETFKLSGLLDANLLEYREDVEEIANSAVKELQIEEKLAGIASDWSDKTLTFSPFKTRGLIILNGGATVELMEQLEEAQMLLGSLMASRYVAPFKEDVQEWITKLSTVSEILEQWVQVQAMWMYLEAVFTSGDIAKQLPQESKRFQGIDKNWVKIMSKANEQPVVVQYCYGNDVLQQLLPHLLEQLEMCQKALSGYLDQKRAAFPRFYFVSDPNLLEILSQGSNPEAIQPHLQSVFDSIEYVEFHKQERTQIQTIFSDVGESIQLRSRVKAEGNIEDWLNALLREMQNSLRAIVRDAASDCEALDTADLTHKYQAQVALIAIQFKWTADCEDALFRAKSERAPMMATNKKNQGRLNDLVNMNMLKDDDLRKYGKWTRRKLETMITVDVHQRDVWEDIVKRKVRDTEDFEWQKQARFYWRYDMDYAMISVADVDFKYCNEYLGVKERLVITPLTDRCYITLAQALGMFLGGAPAGPAGTGKTETTKDLGRGLAIWVIVQNCSDQMTNKVMANFFSGLAQTGAWGCFDEFNRISVEVLSVVAGQYLTILDGIRSKKTLFTFEEDEITLNPTVGAFITMNPGYLGRTELPESLKVLFRPVTVMVPDMQMIMENMLMAEGYTTASNLAKKFFTLYRLLGDLLSKQMHYDWGLRAIKSVLVVAGGFKRGEPDRPEGGLLMRALRDFNLPKIVEDDMVVFMGLLKDLFPDVFDSMPRKRDIEFETLVGVVAKESNLQPSDYFVQNVVDLQDLLDIRHCVFEIGSSGNNKSKCWQTLSKVWTKGGVRGKTTFRDINPKSITPNELYGYVNMATREWKDGLLSSTMREMATMPDTNPKWIVLDGDLDANWIENMNSVMDDNRLLTLASNERIRLLPHMRMIFEIRDLNYASPATVTRAGILFISEMRQWKNFVLSWVDTFTGNEPVLIKQEMRDKRAATLRTLFDKYCDVTMDVLRREYKTPVPILDFNMVQTLCFFLEGLLTEENVGRDDSKFEIYFVLAAVWAFGSAYAITSGTDYRKKFSAWWKEQWKTVKFPHRGEVFDFFVDKEKGEFAAWADIVPTLSYSSSEPMSSVTVPTGETVAITFWLDNLMPRKHPAMLIGAAGCGKTAIINGKLRALGDDYLTSSVNVNYYTNSNLFLKILEGPLEKKAGKNYGPPGSKKLVYFVDDLNMAALDKYNTASNIALMLQHCTYGHVYDMAKLTQKVLLNTQYLTAMNPTAGSFIIDPRMQRLFATFAVGFPGAEALTTIYQTFLLGHLHNFHKDIEEAEMGKRVVQAALQLHRKVATTFRKTASNFHYEFNIRHMAGVFQGILMGGANTFKEPLQLAQLWLHESERVYGDRLVSREDLKKYKDLAAETAKKIFKEMSPTTLMAEPLIICHFAQGLGEKTYDRVQTFGDLSTTLTAALAEFNETNAAMNLVLFEDAIRHVCRISRIIESPGGHALLVGVGGSGKQSLSRLSAFISGYSTFQIKLSPTYGVADFKLDLMALYNKVGLKSEPTVFLFTDQQIFKESVLVYFNNFLSSGVIPDLYNDEDKDTVINGVRNEVKAAGLLDTRDNCWAFFIDKVRANLHVIMCMSPVGDTFRVRCRKFPALSGCTTIDWFMHWPQEALISVAARFLEDVEMETPEHRAACGEHMAFVHESVGTSAAQYKASLRRNVYTTPKSYLELIALYKQMLAAERARVSTQTTRLETGLIKLRESSEQVADMQFKLTEESAVVAVKSKETDLLIIEVGKESNIAADESEKAAIEEEKVTLIQTEVSAFQAQCLLDLAAAEPALKAAEDALNLLDKNSLTELKSLGTPPPAVLKVTAACAYMLAPVGTNLKKLDVSWNAGKKMMGSPEQFLQQLLNFDKDNLWVEAKDNWVRNYTGPPDKPDPEFTYENMATKSKAAAGLCAWVVNICIYHDIFLDVEPKRIKLAEAEKTLKDANDRLVVVRKRVQDLNDKCAALQQQLSDATDEKNRLIEKAESTAKRLNLAERLVNGLKDEGVRWTHGVDELKAQLGRLVGDILVTASFIAYIGPFNMSFRQRMINEQWIPDVRARGIPSSDSIVPVKMLSGEATVAEWNSQGLPADALSIENGAIITQCSRWPLIVDPQLQGVTWIKQREEKNGLVVTGLGAKGYIDKVIRAMQEGLPILLENIGENIDAVLEPVIARSFIKKGRKLMIKIGDAELDVMSAKDADGMATEYPAFKMYIQTKLPNPHYIPEIQAQTTMINFTVTEKGLEDQLLNVVVNKERPDLEEARMALVEQQNQFTIKLKELEDDLLYRLATAEGDILSDEDLIISLEVTKVTVTEINVKVKEGKVTEDKINEAREAYRPTAARGSIIYFLLNQLNVIDHMYQFSLGAFNFIFSKALNKAEATEEGLKVRCNTLLDSVQYTIFSYVTRGLFERHRLIFSCLLTMKVLQSSGELLQEEIDLLIKAPKNLDRENPCSVWLLDAAWFSVVALSSQEAFANLPQDVEGSWKRWKEWIESEQPEKMPLPQEWKRLGGFQRLQVVRAVRPDRMMLAIALWVRESIGNKYVDAIPFNLKVSFEDSAPAVPIFFLLSPGVDPVVPVRVLGAQLGKTEEAGKFVTVSLGQGQEPASRKLIAAGMAAGSWVVLQNCHLGLKYMVEVEQQLIKLEEDQVNPNFRLWITVEPHPKFPIGLLQISIKITNEPPVGIRAGLKGSYAWLNQDVLDTVSQPQWKTMLYALCFMHTAVQERRKFGPLGFNVPYEFNQSDLSASVQFMQNHLNEVEGKKRPVDWIVVNYMVCEVQYGGKITDDWDRRLFNTYGQAWLTSRITNSEFEFYPGYRIPVGTDVEVFRKYIEELPFNDNPEIFGLHVNADLSYRTLQTAAVLTTILDSQPKEGGGSGGLTREETVLKIVEDLQAKLPGNFNMEEKKQCIKAIGGMNKPLNICLSQEIDRLQNVLTLVRRMLANLKLAIAGTIVMSPELQNTLDSLFLARVPAEWAKVSQLIMPNIGLWFVSILGRHEQLYSWMKNNRPNCFWLTGFFNPQGFLTANRQEVCRKHVKENWALDDVISTYEVLKQERDEVKRGPEEGIYLYGLYLDGCKWDKERMRLVDSDPKVLFAPLPVLLISACLQTARKIDPNHNYICPMYKNPTRTGLNFITPVDLRTEEPPNKWTLRGVCLLTSKD